MTGQGQDRRKYVRLETALPLSFERRGPLSVLQEEGTTRNVSAGGLCFLSPVPLGVGEKLSMTLRLPTDKALSFHGRVKWVQPVRSSSYEIGFEISEISLEDQNQYLLFVCGCMVDRLKTLQFM